MIVLNKKFYNHVKYLLKNKQIEKLKAYLTAPEQLLFIGKEVQNDKNSSYFSREDIYSVYNYIRSFFKDHLDLLDYLLEHKFHEAPVLKKTKYGYLHPEQLFSVYSNQGVFCDEDFIQIFALFRKHSIELDGLLKSVYWCEKLTLKSLEWLLANGVDLHSEKNQDILANPPRNYYTYNEYEKTSFLIKASASVNAVRIREYESRGEHAFDNLFSSSSFHVPYLFLYIQNGAQKKGFIHQLVSLRSKKGVKFKYVLIRLYLDHNPNLIDEYNDEGFTPLHLAIANEDEQMVALLLEYKADVTLETKNIKAKTVKKRKIKQHNTALDLGELVNNLTMNSLLTNSSLVLTNTSTSNTANCTLDSVFHQNLLRNITKTFVFVKEQKLSHLFAEFKKETLDVDLPIIPKIVHDLAIACWGDLKKHHYQLLHIALVLGGQRFSWSTEKEGGAIMFASWIELLNKNVFCRHEDIGVTFANPNKKNIQFNFSATYESHKVFHLSLTLEQYLEKIFECLGLEYWMYCFISPKYNLMTKVSFFEESLQDITETTLKMFCEKS